jgi:DNA-binding transcriptional ArsR family regulator
MAYGMYTGSPEGAEVHLAPLRAVGPPVFDTFGPISYYDLQQALGQEIVYGLQLKWRGGYFRDGGFGDDAFASIVDAVRRQPSGFSMLRFDLLGGGAIGAVARDATAFVHRDAMFNISIIAQWVRDDETEANLRWVDGAAQGAGAAPVRRGVPELRRRGARGLGERVLRRQLSAPARGEAPLRPDRLLPLPAEHPPAVTPWRACGRRVAWLTYNQMVVDQLTDEAVDHLFHALADSTRRDILRGVRPASPSVSRLAETYPMSFAAVQKHVAVLERAGLVTKERRGREQLVRTNLEAVSRARQALDQVESAWRGRVDRMADLLKEDRRPRR